MQSVQQRRKSCPAHSKPIKRKAMLIIFQGQKHSVCSHVEVFNVKKHIYTNAGVYSRNIIRAQPTYYFFTGTLFHFLRANIWRSRSLSFPRYVYIWNLEIDIIFWGRSKKAPRTEKMEGPEWGRPRKVGSLWTSLGGIFIRKFRFLFSSPHTFTFYSGFCVDVS